MPLGYAPHPLHNPPALTVTIRPHQAVRSLRVSVIGTPVI